MVVYGAVNSEWVSDVEDGLRWEKWIGGSVVDRENKREVVLEWLDVVLDGNSGEVYGKNICEFDVVRIHTSLPLWREKWISWRINSSHSMIPFKTAWNLSLILSSVYCIFAFWPLYLRYIHLTFHLKSDNRHHSYFVISFLHSNVMPWLITNYKFRTKSFVAYSTPQGESYAGTGLSKHLNHATDSVRRIGIVNWRGLDNGQVLNHYFLIPLFLLLHLHFLHFFTLLEFIYGHEKSNFRFRTFNAWALSLPLYIITVCSYHKLRNNSNIIGSKLKGDKIPPRLATSHHRYF